MPHHTPVRPHASASLYFAEAESAVLHTYAARKTLIQILGLTLLGCSIFSAVHAYAPAANEYSIHFLDVGQGDAALITLASPHARHKPVRILVDAGRDGSVLHALDAALRNTRTTYLDAVILTHQDSDHFGGLERVLAHYDVGALISNGRSGSGESWQRLIDTLDMRGIPHHLITAGDTVRYGEARADILFPTHEFLVGTSVNEASVVFMLSTPNETHTTRTLFTGDIGHPAEAALLAHDPAALTADVLKVGHHGSKHSSSAAFIHAVSPRLSVISVGTNSYGHPAPEVIDVLMRAGSEIRTTKEYGTIYVPLTSKTAPHKSKDTNGFLASILLGLSRAHAPHTTTIPDAEHAPKNTLVPVETCSFDASRTGTANHQAYINEIAWMGSETGATHEWVELWAPETPADLSGWQLINANGKIHATFPQGFIARDPYILIARSAANEALSLNADLLFSGALRNTNEGLRLFTNTCILVDDIPVERTWPAGDAKTKRTMERGQDGIFHTSTLPGGTPGEENSVSVPSDHDTDEYDDTEQEKSLYLSASAAENQDGIITVTVFAAELPHGAYDLKVSLTNAAGTEISETFHDTEQRWRASLYYLQSAFTGTTHEGDVRLRRKQSFNDAAGTTTLTVRLRTHGKSTAIEHTQEFVLAIPPVPVPTIEKQKTEVVATTQTPKPPPYTITASHPATITAGTAFTVYITGTNLQDAPYDIKVSVESGTVLSRTLRNGTWASSQFYITQAFSGPSVNAFPVELMIATSTNPLPNTAELIIRIRTGDASGTVVYRAPVTISTPVPPTEPPTPETPSPEEEVVPDEQEPAEEYNDQDTDDPEPEEALATPEADPGPDDSQTEPAACVNINTADHVALQTIIQIGPTLATRIIEARAASPFTSLDDLLHVSGIGAITLEKIKAQGLACV